MINNIKLVSSFASKDKSSVISNVLVKEGKMTAQNGLVGICIPVESDVDFCCNAERLSQVLKSCDADKLKSQIKNGRIYFSSGKFKSNIELVDLDLYPQLTPDGELIDIQHDIITQINSITQFTDTNDVRPALQGVAISDGWIKATNGHMAIKKKINQIPGFEEIIIPSKAIQFLFKANTIINSISIQNSNIYFNFEDGFLYSKSIDNKMPDIDRVISDIKNPISLESLKNPIKSISDLCTNKTLIFGKTISNTDNTASIDGFDLPNSAFNSDYLLKIIDVADQIDLSRYPAPCPFSGDGIFGAVSGIKI